MTMWDSLANHWLNCHFQPWMHSSRESSQRLAVSKHLLRRLAKKEFMITVSGLLPQRQTNGWSPRKLATQGLHETVKKHGGCNQHVVLCAFILVVLDVQLILLLMSFLTKSIVSPSVLPSLGLCSGTFAQPLDPQVQVCRGLLLCTIPHGWGEGLSGYLWGMQQAWAGCDPFHGHQSWWYFCWNGRKVTRATDFLLFGTVYEEIMFWVLGGHLKSQSWSYRCIRPAVCRCEKAPATISAYCIHRCLRYDFIQFGSRASAWSVTSLWIRVQLLFGSKPWTFFAQLDLTTS